METALVISLLCIGAAAGGLIVAAWKSDPPRYSQEPTEAGRDFQEHDVERRARRVQ